MKLLITGICGFIGSTLAKAWLAAEPDLIILGVDNLCRAGSEQNRAELQNLGIKLFHGDLRLPSDLEGLPAADWVLDAAANPSVLAGVNGQSSSRQLIEHNLLATVNLLEYCKRHRAGLILLSSSRVYSITALATLRFQTEQERLVLDSQQLLPMGVSSEGISESFSTTPPLSLYGSSKLASEILAIEYGSAFDFPVWIDRCGILAGAGQFGRADQGILAFWINTWLRRRPLTYLGFGGLGHQVRDAIHPRDLLPLLRRQVAATTSNGSRIFNVGGGADQTFSLAELSRWCDTRFGRHEVPGDPRQRPYDLPWVVMDSTLARQVWDWQPQTGLETILEEIAIHAETHPDWLERTGRP